MVSIRSLGTNVLNVFSVDSGSLGARIDFRALDGASEGNGVNIDIIDEDREEMMVFSLNEKEAEYFFDFMKAMEITLENNRLKQNS